MRDDPMDGEEAALVVEVDPDALDAEGLAAAADAAGGTVEESLQFDSYRVRLPETAVADFCETTGLAVVETANVTSPGDAGEDY
jgi:hypothetical protein